MSRAGWTRDGERRIFRAEGIVRANGIERCFSSQVTENQTQRSLVDKIGIGFHSRKWMAGAILVVSGDSVMAAGTQVAPTS